MDEIRALLRLVDGRDQPCAEARDVAATHLADVSAKIADLKRMERVLKDLIAQCADGTLPSGEKANPPISTPGYATALLQADTLSLRAVWQNNSFFTLNGGSENLGFAMAGEAFRARFFHTLERKASAAGDLLNDL